MITVRGLKKRFGKLEVLKGIDMVLEPGSITAVLGPNGSGKTTLIKCLLGQVRPDEGIIEFEGKPVREQWKYRNEIGYLSQIARFPENLTVKELTNMVEDIREKKGVKENLVSDFGLVPYMDKKLKYLSGGTRQKVNLLLTFMFDCPLYILDEPTAGLDPVAMLKFKNMLRAGKKRNKTILVTTHIINLVGEIADRLVFILEGRIYFNGLMDEMIRMEGKQNLEHAIAGILMKENDQNS